MPRPRINDLSGEELAREMELLREEIEKADQAQGMFLLLVETEVSLIESGEINPDRGETVLGLATGEDGALFAIIGHV